MSPESFPLSPQCSLQVEEGDITRVAVDAVVNAANARLLGGGGVDGAIHRRAGPQLLAACRGLPEVLPGVRCPAGEARITPGFQLPTRYVIHTVGPVYSDHDASSPILASAYQASLDLANAQGLGSIAFPAISCGVYGYPLRDAARIAIGVCRDYHGDLAHIRFVLFGDEAYQCWSAVARELLG